RPDLRHEAFCPVAVLGQFAAQPGPLLVALILPQVPDLVQHPDLRGPGAEPLAVAVAAHLRTDFRRELQIVRHLARREGIGAQFVEHASSPDGRSARQHTRLPTAWAGECGWGSREVRASRSCIRRRASAYMLG